MSGYIEQLVGYPASDFSGNRIRTYGSIIHPDDRPFVIDEVDQAVRRRAAYALEYRLVHADGTLRWIADHGRAVVAPDGTPSRLEGVLLDISRAKLAERARDRAEAQLRHHELHDGLTGLPNRVLFRDLVGQAVESGRREHQELAVLTLDVDGFKEINDTLGHAAGDEVLKQVAERLSKLLRANDSIARLGDDEFAILLPKASAPEAAEFSSRLPYCLEQPIVVDGLPINIDVSVGVAAVRRDELDADLLLQRADAAVHFAKTARAGFAKYGSSTDSHVPNRLALVGELRGALDRGELVLHYQPQLAMPSGTVVGVEALVRWQHPERGLIPPDEFIPLVQETGLIKPLTHYVLDMALRQCRSWLDDGRAMRVAVNLAMRNLVDAELPFDVANLLVRNGVPSDRLELEITERAFLADQWRTQAVLERLGNMGIRLSVDDFGMDYSPLSYLKRLPIKEIKIDRSLVANLSSSRDDEVIVRSTIDLARNLGLEVVAEGVETVEVLRGLERLGCHLAQGYYVSRPLPVAELDAWLATPDCLSMMSQLTIPTLAAANDAHGSGEAGDLLFSL